MPDIDTGEEIVMVTPVVVRVATHPQNDKIQDSLLTRVNWTRADCDLLSRCLANYE